MWVHCNTPPLEHKVKRFVNLQSLNISLLSGRDAKSYALELAKLRINVFRSFPYLYDGDLTYESHYLDTYFQAKSARVVACFDSRALVGASTVVGLKDESEDFAEPFLKHGLDPNDVMYFGESMLLPEYRGLGVGKRFFEERLKYAQNSRAKWAAFCAVVRADDHPLRPIDYKPLDGLWLQFGFEPVKDLTTKISWRQIDSLDQVKNSLQVWIKKL